TAGLFLIFQSAVEWRPVCSAIGALEDPMIQRRDIECARTLRVSCQRICEQWKAKPAYCIFGKPGVYIFPGFSPIRTLGYSAAMTAHVNRARDFEIHSKRTPKITRNDGGNPAVPFPTCSSICALPQYATLIVAIAGRCIHDVRVEGIYRQCANT